MKRFKKGDLVIMKEWYMPKSEFRTGVVTESDSFGTMRVKRDYYRGHENTWHFTHDWKKYVPPCS